MAKRDSPLLHLVPGGKDPGVFDEELSWFFGALASASGERSCMGAQIAVLSGLPGANYSRESNFYSDPQTGWPKNLKLPNGRPFPFPLTECYFRTGRRLWCAFKVLPFKHQETLRRHYAEIAQDPDPPSDRAIRQAHAAFYAMRKEQVE